MGPAHHGEAPASCPVLGLSESVSKRDRGAFSSPSLLTLLRQCLGFCDMAFWLPYQRPYPFYISPRIIATMIFLTANWIPLNNVNEFQQKVLVGTRFSLEGFPLATMHPTLPSRQIFSPPLSLTSHCSLLP
jgi:hypothetical protein